MSITIRFGQPARTHRIVVCKIPLLARALGINAEQSSCQAKRPLVYKIPYRRAPCLAYQPLGRVRRASKGILHTKRPQATIRYLVFNSYTGNASG